MLFVLALLVVAVAVSPVSSQDPILTDVSDLKRILCSEFENYPW